MQRLKFKNHFNTTILFVSCADNHQIKSIFIEKVSPGRRVNCESAYQIESSDSNSFIVIIGSIGCLVIDSTLQ